MKLFLVLFVLCFALTASQKGNSGSQGPVLPPIGVPPAPPPTTQQQPPAKGTLTVSGTSKIVVTNNVADISFSIDKTSSDVAGKGASLTQIQAVSSADVQAAVAEIADAITNFLNTKLSVTKLKTTSFSLSQVSEWDQPTQTVVSKGWRASEGFFFRVTVLSDVGEILDGLTENGATSIGGISFVPSDESLENAKLDAIQNAGQNAKARAEKALTGLGLAKVCIRAPCDFYRVVDAQVDQAVYIPPPVVWGGAMPMAPTADKGAETPTVTVGGESETSASITIRVEYF